MKTISSVKRIFGPIFALLAAWSFDFLFYDKPWGLNFPLYIIILLLAGFGAAAQTGTRPNSRSLWLLLPILFFSIASLFRSDPPTLFFNVLITWVALVGLVFSFTGGRWAEYSFTDILEKLFNYGISIITKPFVWLAAIPSTQLQEKSASRKTMGSALIRGFLIALPILMILSALLASADAVFDTYLKSVFAFFNWDHLAEFVLRTLLVLALAVFIWFTFRFAFESSGDSELRGMEKQGLPRFLGQIESNVVLILVNLLFLFFVVIQFQYLFGGLTNINIQGFTYAEYARRGFGELIAVTVVSLVLLQILHSIVQEEKISRFRTQKILSVLMILQLLIILASAFQRLNLYESAYGFSRLRTYTHVFLIWVAALLVALAILELRQLSRFFPLALFLTAIGFGITLNFLNVDGRIAEWNIDRAKNSGKLDISYLGSLSYDALPVLVREYQSSTVEQEQRVQIGAALACMVERFSNQPDQNILWQGYSISRVRGEASLDQVTAQIDGYQRFMDENYNRYVVMDGIRFECDSAYTE